MMMPLCDTKEFTCLGMRSSVQDVKKGRKEYLQ